MGLECTPRSQISFMTSCYFIGFGVGIFLFPMPDLYGRKPSIFFSMVGYLVAMVICLFTKTILWRSISLFLIGFFHLRSTTSFVMCFDVVPKSSKSITATAINSYDGATLIFMGIYFAFIKDWFWYQAI